MNIISNSENISKADIYAMTKSPRVKTMNKVDDNTIITIVKWLEYEDINNKNEAINIFAFIGIDGQAYACQSETFKEQCRDIIDIFGLPVSIMKLSGKTKSGREYITCDYADDITDK